MGKKLGIIVGGGLAVLLALGVWFYISSGSGEPSAEVTAPTIATTATTEAAQETTAATDSATTEPADTPEATESTEAPGAGQVTYDIDKTQSTVRFELDEILSGNPKHVVGITSEVAGQVLIDFDNPANSQLGVIVINVRTLTTDSDFRNRAIRGPILGASSDENEFAEFTPTSIAGLPDAIAVGDSVELTVIGDFLLSGVTNEVTFTITVTVVSETEITATGSTTVLRSEYDLNIPDVPNVANVTDEVELVVDFVAISG